MSSIPESKSVTDYVADGARIAAILLIWGVIAAFFIRSFVSIFVTGSRISTCQAVKTSISGSMAVTSHRRSYQLRCD
jgi:hypothetical protein